MIPFKTRIKSGVVQRLEVIESLSFQGQELTPGAATDEKAKISANDTTAGYLNGKLVAGSGIVLTENNNGGNETLTISANAVDLDVKVSVSANDTTAGYLNGKLVAGTGIVFTENNNGGDETLTLTLGSHTHAASDITSGIIATARLATGTANSTAYLRGDQTWQTLANAAVTSFNGQTGAVTAGVEQTYTTACLDAENSNLTTNVVRVTIPGGTGAPGAYSLVHVDFLYHTRNLSGSNILLSAGLLVNGTSIATSTNTVFTGNNYYGRVRQWFLWDNNNNVIRTVSPGQNAIERNVAGPTYIDNTAAYWSFDSFPTVTLPNTSFDIAFTATWNSASPSAFVRILNARAYRQPGQTT